jgi:site-specific DNA-methyltransferase (adenine-specific)
MARQARKSKICRAGGPPAAVPRRRTGAPVRHSPKGDGGSAIIYPAPPECINPLDGIVLEPSALAPLNCVYRDDPHGIFLYQGDCLEVMDAIYGKHPDGCFDMIFADPPYFLSNGGITCHAGKMVKVDKGDWDSLASLKASSSAKVFGADKMQATDLMHEFNTEWLKRCQRVLKPNGTIWITGTHHVIFSVGYAMQQLGYKILNDIAWEKPNPPPNLSCRYFTHSTETILWAAKTEKSKHLFNYKAMKAVTGKQMKTVWRIPAPGKGEKTFGKHPTQKPVALVERCILSSTHEGDRVLDPFLGGGTTAVACVRSYRLFVGIELDYRHMELAAKRTDREIIEIWLREFRIQVNVSVVCPKQPPSCHPEPVEGSLSFSGPYPTKNDPNDLDPGSGSMDRIREMADAPEIQAESIFHETKFVFLSCAQPRTGSVVHTTIDADVQSAWTHTPQSVKLQTTHIVRCETEILRMKNS